MDILKLRKKLQLTQVGLANKVGVCVQTVRLWEQGGMKPSKENLEKLENLLKG